MINKSHGHFFDGMDLNNKVIVGLERISEVFKTMLWEKAKVHGISPIQIQTLLFIAHHKPALCNVSHLAKEFNVTKPTISDVIRVLDKKGLVEKDHSSADSRSYSLFVSAIGKELIKELESYSLPLQQELSLFGESELASLYATVSKLIFQLNRAGILSVQRTCFGCKFYSKQDSTHYCQLLQTNLVDEEIRLDCAEYQKA